jgi:hypothetical protein
MKIQISLSKKELYKLLNRILVEQVDDSFGKTEISMYDKNGLEINPHQISIISTDN